jgi:hypothetical protein
LWPFFSAAASTRPLFKTTNLAEQRHAQAQVSQHQRLPIPLKTELLRDCLPAAIACSPYRSRQAVLGLTTCCADQHRQR